MAAETDHDHWLSVGDRPDEDLTEEEEAARESAKEDAAYDRYLDSLED